MKNPVSASTVFLSRNFGLDNRGFTMIEVMVAVLITAVVGTAIVVSHQAQQRAATQVRQMADMQQQMRGVFTIMAEDIRLAGYNRTPEAPDDQRQFGIMQISPSLALAYDFDRLHPNTEANSNYEVRCTGVPGLSAVTTGDGQLNEPFYSYFLSDPDPNDGSTFLARQVTDNQCASGNVTEILAENIEAVDFAFAFDNDGDGLLDRGAGAAAIIWAVDTTGDNNLDTNLDLDGNGQINADDDPDNDGTIGVDLGYSVSRDKIRAVRIWLLANSDPDPKFADSRTYVVGRNVYDAQNFSATQRMKRRLLMDHIVDCRNMWPPAQM